MAKPVKHSGKRDFSKGKSTVKKSFDSKKGSKPNSGASRSNLDDSSLSSKPEFSKKERKEKPNKPVFKRFKDETRPSQFGTAAKPERNSATKPSSKENRPSTKPKKWNEEGDKKSSFAKKENKQPKSFGKSGYSDKPSKSKKATSLNPNDIDDRDLAYESKSYNDNTGRGFKRKKLTPGRKGESTPQKTNDDGLTRLNKYLSNAGICSRREADELIATGVVQVNGKTITEMGYRVKPTDIVNYGGQTLKKEKSVYLVLNKPKDYITTANDPRERKTVLELVHGACKERIYPVGRLDRATTGLLMFTNDGDLTKKLTHPRYGVKKLYHVVLDKPLRKVDLEKIVGGLELEDGSIQVDELAYVGNGADKTQVGVQIHSGKNRIVRRIFAHMGYNVRKLDRVMFGSLTKKDLPRGRWRMLSEAEVGMLKMISSE